MGTNKTAQQDILHQLYQLINAVRGINSKIYVTKYHTHRKEVFKRFLLRCCGEIKKVFMSLTDDNQEKANIRN